MGREFQPFDVGSRLRIVPPQSAGDTTERIELTMAPGAFGSGEHETTASCLQILESLPDLRNAHVLDLGSGTGILSIAALKLGAARALCVDIDREAVATCRTNCRLNGVENRVEHLCGSLQNVQALGFNLVLANIYGDILLDVAAPLVARTRSQGTLVLSGILWEYNFQIRQRYQALGCQVVKNSLLEEFSTLVLKKLNRADFGNAKRHP